MSLESRIIAAKEELDEIYKDMSNEIVRLNRAMKENVQNIKEKVDSIGQSWKSGDYNNFKHSMDNAVARMETSTEKLDSLNNIMTEAERELAKILEKLRSKYGN